MSALEKLQRYLKRCGIECPDAVAYDLSSEFPVAIAARYDAMRLTVFGEPRIVFEPRSEVMPAELVTAYRQIDAVQRAVAVLDFADREFSESLRKEKIDYIVPGRQICVPPYAMLAPPEAYERSEKVYLREFLSPWAQVVFFRVMLFHAEEQSVPYAELHGELPIKDVYLTRACQELAYHHLAVLGKKGRSRFMSFAQDRRLLWRSAEKCLRSPVVKCIRYTGKMDDAVTAGYPALAKLSDMAPDGDPVFAMTLAETRKLDGRKIRRYNGAEIEIWRYSPRLLARDGYVDPLSLYMSLKDSPDARIKIALASLLEKTL